MVWQTNTANKGVTGIKLLPNGNLVLYDKNGKFVWQSFDYPSDTLLVGMSLRLNGRNKLVSRVSEIDGSDGKYSMVFEKKGLTMYINNDGQLLQYGGWPGDDFGTAVTFEAIPANDNATAFELVLTGYQEAAPTPPPSGRRRLLQVPLKDQLSLKIIRFGFNTISYS